MAEDKKGFVLYADLIHTINKMPSDKAGDLFKHILSYVNDQNPTTDDMLIDLVFEPIKQQLKRDLKKYEETKIDKSSSGSLGNLKRWHLDLYNDVISKKKTLEESLIIAKGRTAIKPIANIAVKDTVTVKDNDTMYTQTDFLNDWKKARLHYDKQPTNITSLKPFEVISFNNILKDYGSTDFYNAINGLFFQETFKQTRLRPSHFLDNFETYLTCWQTKEKLFENKKKETKL